MTPPADHRTYESGDEGHVERIGTSAAELLAAIEAGAAEAGRRIRVSARTHPYLTVGAAAAVGWLAGGRLARHVTALMLPIASRVALSTVLHDVSRALEQRDGGDGEAMHMNGAAGASPGDE